MSRVGKAIINVPADVTVTIKGSHVEVKGKLGTLELDLTQGIEAKLEDNTITVTRPSDHKSHRSLHGTYRALIANMVEGVSKGFEKQLEFIGVGYRAAVQGQVLDLTIGFSHTVQILLPKEIKAEAVSEKGKNPIVKLFSHDKQLVGMIASKIRSLRKPEPYKGKGIKYVGEYIRRKDGKSA